MTDGVEKERGFYMIAILSLLITVICLILFGLIFVFAQEGVSESSKVFTRYDINKEDFNTKTDEELILEFAKDVIIRNVSLNEDIKWGRNKILEKDIYEKYLIYIEFESQNTFGAYVNNSVIMCIKIDEDRKTYSYRKNPVCCTINKADSLNNIIIPNAYKKEFKWNENVLYEIECKEKYNIKNFFKWSKEFFYRLNNSTKELLKIIKTNRKVQIFLGIIVIILGINIIKNLEIIEVPNMVGMTVAEANNYIKGKHLELKIYSTGNSSEIIVSQGPEKGKVKINYPISVTTKEYKIMDAKPSNLTVVDAAKTLISSNLKSSSTAVWGSNCQVLDEDEYGRYLVYISVEAQNGFGAYIKSAYMVVLQTVDKGGDFTYKPFSYYIESSVVSNLVNPIEDYKEGYINEPLQNLLNNANWNQEKVE